MKFGPGNRRLIMCTLMMAALLQGGAWLKHDYYVSLTEIRYNEDTDRLEISMRIFPDDLDHALKKQHGISTRLATRLEPPEADSLLERYLDDHFNVKVNGREVPLTYLGKEPESDAIWCYLESDPVPRPATIGVRNSILVYDFEDQINIVQVYVGNWNRGVLLSGEQDSETMEIGR